MSAKELGLEEIYLRHHAALHRFLTRLLRCEDAAAEVAQDSYLRLLRLAPQAGLNNPRAYLFQVAANVARDRMAREQRRSLVLQEAAPPEPPSSPGAEAEVIARDRLRILSAAVDELPPRCRAVFLMSRLDGLSNGEIAGRLGISRNMVEKHIIKAMLHCRGRLDSLDD